MANFKQYKGDIDFQQGTVTDQETGKIYLYRDWVNFVNDSRRKELQEMLKQRDLRSDAQNLPGNKPYFEDDWFGYFPAQIDQRGKYPYELGFRSPYPPVPES